MSQICWPEGTRFRRVELSPEERSCSHCGHLTYVCDHKERRLHTLQGPWHLVSKATRCPDKSCPGHGEILKPQAQEMTIAPPWWTISWEVFAWMGHRRFKGHWSVPQIREELKDRYEIDVSSDLIESYLDQYQTMVAARESDVERLRAEYRDVPELILAIDGIQPEKGHETLYVVRELWRQRVLFAQPLLSSAAGEVKQILERARQLAGQLGKSVQCWMSDKQQAFVTGIAEVFPGVVHRYCANHFLRDLAKPVLDQDSHAKVQMRRKVRGLRDVERQLLAERRQPAQQPPAAAEPAPRASEGQSATGCQLSPPPLDEGAVPPPAAEQADGTTEAHPTGLSEASQVALDYCAAVRGILNDDQGGPLHPPGMRMADALREVSGSIQRNLDGQKGGPVHRRSASCRRASRGGCNSLSRSSRNSPLMSTK